MTFILLSKKLKPVLHSLVYVLAIFLTYFCLGTVLIIVYKYFGLSLQFNFSVFDNLFSQPPIWALYLEIAIGLICLIYGLFFYTKKANLDKPKTQTRVVSETIFSSFLLGVTITGLEASTALPYFGAISTIYLANLTFVSSIILVLIYCVIFILPPLFVIMAYILFKDQFQQTTEKVRKILSQISFPLFKYGTAVLGLILITDAILFLQGIKLF